MSPLKGLFKVKKALADRSTRFYCYAWRGGPLLVTPDGAPMQPDDPSFPEAFKAAHDKRRNPDTGDLAMLVREFRQSSDFRTKSAASKREYHRYLDDICRRFGGLTLANLEDKATRGQFKAWRDEMAATPRTADYAWTTLARVLSVAKDRGRLAVNVCERGGRLYKADRSEKIWTVDNIAKFKAFAPKELRLALTMALWTGQRQGDLLRAPWSAYDGKTLKVRQGKTGARVAVPIGQPLRELLSATVRVALTILTNAHGKSWTSEGFRRSWRKACAEAGVMGLTFHDLRGTAVTRMALAGCTAA
jgi:integrase